MRVLQITMLVLSCSISAASVDGETAPIRRLDRDGLKLELAPLALDQVRAFYLGRGFPIKEVEHIVATGCVFRSAIGNAYLNSGDPKVTVTLKQWRIAPEGGGVMAPRTREDWELDWKARAIEEEAATAFYWSLFPTEQTFAPADYNWGLLTFGLAPGARFGLDISWRSADRPYSVHMEGLECPK